MRRLKTWLLAQTQGENRRIVFGLVGGLLVCLWCLVAFWIWWERNSLIESQRKVLEQQVVSVHEQTHSLFRRAETSLIVAQHWIQAHPQLDPGRAPEFLSLVDKLRRATDELVDIRLITRNGTLRYIPDMGQTRGTRVDDRDYFQAQFDPATRGLYVAKPVRSRVTGKLGLPISLPVEKAGGDVVVIFAAIELDRIVGTFEHERLKPNGTIAFFRDDGMFLFRSPLEERFIGRSIGQSAPWTQHFGPHARGSFLLQNNPIDGTDRLVAHSRVLDFPLVVAVSASLEDVLVPWWRHAVLLVVLALFVSVACLLLAATLMRSLRSEAAARHELEHLMLTDPLTGTGNRRLLMLRLEDEVQRAQRYARPLTAVFLDLDHFKQVNDKHGHDVGDTALVEVATCIKARLRQSDHVARFGGEEFVLLLTETPLDAALPLVEHIRTTISTLHVHGLPGRITASAGLAQWRDGEAGEDLLRRADQALYQAKATGRNRSCSAN